MALHSHVVAIQLINKSDSVGYNHQYVAKSATKIAIAAIGYGNGYPQSAPNGTMVSINNKLYSIADRVSMELMAIDIGYAPEINIGDSVTLFGSGNLLVDNVA